MVVSFWSNCGEMVSLQWKGASTGGVKPPGDPQKLDLGRAKAWFEGANLWYYQSIKKIDNTREKALAQGPAAFSQGGFVKGRKGLTTSLTSGNHQSTIPIVLPTVLPLPYYKLFHYLDPLAWPTTSPSSFFLGTISWPLIYCLRALRRVRFGLRAIRFLVFRWPPPRLFISLCISSGIALKTSFGVGVSALT